MCMLHILCSEGVKNEHKILFIIKFHKLLLYAHVFIVTIIIYENLNINQLSKILPGSVIIFSKY